MAQRRHDMRAPAPRRGSTARDEARLLRTVVDAAPALLSYWDTAERNVIANEAYARWFGREPDELRGLHLRELLGAEAYEDDREHIRRVLGVFRSASSGT